MMKILRNIARKTTVLVAVFLLNISSVVQCGSLLMDDDCCHTQNLVKPCCVKHLKITSDPRITGNCGCAMRESQQPADMYVDLSTIHSRHYTQGFAHFAIVKEAVSLLLIKTFTLNYSPPNFSQGEVFLCNMNLRI